MYLRIIFNTIVTLCMLLILNEYANAQCGYVNNPNQPFVPRTLQFQGRLTDPGGSPVPDSTYSVFFTIYCNNTEWATSKWSETQSIATEEGLFSVLLGSVNPIWDTVFDYSNCPEWRYLGIKVGDDPEITPRTWLVPTPYSMRVATVDGACGGNIRGQVAIGDARADGLDAFAVGNGCDADANASTVTGGSANNIQSGAHHSVIGGGQNNNILDDGVRSTIAGGMANYVWDSLVAIGGGKDNRATGYCSTIPGGYKDSTDGDFSFAAGFRAKALHDGTFVWGDSTNADFESTGPNQFLVRANGGVGINMNNPQADLHINGEMRFGIASGDFRIQEVLATGPEPYSEFIDYHGIGIGSPTGSNRQMIMFTDGIAHDNIFTVTASPDAGANWYTHFAIEQWGDIGVGTATPNYTLDVRGTIGNNSTLYHSDKRWKKNIATLSNSLDKVQRLRGVSYDWKRDEFLDMKFAEGRQIGLIAQEVEQVIPEVVNTGRDGYKSVDYSKLVALLIEANKEQQKQIVSQQVQINELKILVQQLADKSELSNSSFGNK